MASEKRKLKKKAWDKFSTYIRLKYADWRGYVECVTCGKVSHYKKGMQAGHFTDGRRNSVLFNEKNCHPQCYGCNCGKNGNKVEYFVFMEKVYGREVIDELRQKNKETKEFTIEELQEIYDKYSKLSAELENEKGK